MAFTIISKYQGKTSFVQRHPKFCKRPGLFKNQKSLFRIQIVTTGCYCSVPMLNSGLMCLDQNKPEKEKK